MSITSDAGDAEYVADELETARRWAVRLEGELARAIEAQRSAAVLCERAEADRDTALGRLASCSSEVSAFRHQRDQARAERDETLGQLSMAHHERGAYRRERDEARAERDQVVAALGILVAAVDALNISDPCDPDGAARLGRAATMVRPTYERSAAARVVPPDAHPFDS